MSIDTQNRVRGIIVTVKGIICISLIMRNSLFNFTNPLTRNLYYTGSNLYDFQSRYFAPWVGIPEDPVTGSAHTVLAPYWSEILNKVGGMEY